MGPCLLVCSADSVVVMPTCSGTVNISCCLQRWFYTHLPLKGNALNANVV